EAARLLRGPPARGHEEVRYFPQRPFEIPGSRVPVHRHGPLRQGKRRTGSLSAEPHLAPQFSGLHHQGGRGSLWHGHHRHQRHPGNLRAKLPRPSVLGKGRRRARHRHHARLPAFAGRHHSPRSHQPPVVPHGHCEGRNLQEVWYQFRRILRSGTRTPQNAAGGWPGRDQRQGNPHRVAGPHLHSQSGHGVRSVSGKAAVGFAAALFQDPLAAAEATFMSNRVEALVVGAGISGLATAYALHKAGIATQVVESAPRAGGVIRSVTRDGYLCECGPQSFSGNGLISAMCQDLGILEQRVLADPKAPRYVLINGKLQNVPMGPGLLTSPFMSGGTRGAILRDIFGKSESPEPDESVAAFIRRKFSETLLDRLVGPFVSGIYAGDPEKLSLRAAFPILYEAEKASGSILRGIFHAIKTRAAKRPKGPKGPRERPTLQTFTEGNEMLIKALALNLGERLQCGVEVTGIEHLDSGHDAKAPRFRVALRTPQEEEIVEAERLVLAVPTNVAGKLLGAL